MLDFDPAVVLPVAPMYVLMSDSVDASVLQMLPSYYLLPDSFFSPLIYVGSLTRVSLSCFSCFFMTEAFQRLYNIILFFIPLTRLNTKNTFPPDLKTFGVHI